MSIIKKAKVSFDLTYMIIPLFFIIINLILSTKGLTMSLSRLVFITKMLWFLLIYFKTSFLKKKFAILSYQRQPDCLRLYNVFKSLNTILQLAFVSVPLEIFI